MLKHFFYHSETEVGHSRVIKLLCLLKYRFVTQLCLFLVERHVGAVSLPPGGIIFAQLPCPLDDIIFVYIRNN
jgi:hypothetical protein